MTLVNSVRNQVLALSFYQGLLLADDCRLHCSAASLRGREFYSKNLSHISLQ